MKIALFTETYLPYINGVVTHVKILKEGLEQLGHEVLIVAANADAKKHYMEKDMLHCPGIRYKHFYDYGLAQPKSKDRINLLREFSPDIIHIHNEFGIGYSGVKISKQLQIPLIYTLHTMYDEYLYYIAPKPFVPLVRKIAHVYLRFLGKNATAITGPSKKVEVYFRELGVNKKIHVINNPVELDIFAPSNIKEEEKKAFRTKYNVKEDEMLVCFCGRLGHEKSVDVLLNYWKQTVKTRDKIRLMIIGDGPVRTELEKLSKELGIDDMVIFAGKVMHEEIPPYYACCDLYITASISDTNSISMLEAMATGLPVLHIKDDLNQGQVVHGVNGYIYKDAREMYEHLKNYQNKSNEEILKLREQVRTSVNASGAKNIGANLLAVYEEAIAEYHNAQKSE